jgi:hypothetical protein
MQQLYKQDLVLCRLQVEEDAATQDQLNPVSKAYAVTITS